MTGIDGSLAAVAEYATEPGRSVCVRVRTPTDHWEYGVDADVPHPGASLLKLGLALAVEGAIRTGRLDPDQPVALADIGVRDRDRSALSLLDDRRPLVLADLLRLSLGASDAAASRYLAAQVSVDEVDRAVTAAGCTATTVEVGPHLHAGVAGVTTCRDALALMDAVLDTEHVPLSARALRHSILNSRIPLGATHDDIQIAHKTGTLAGVAHDVARLECTGGVVDVAFLTSQQHDLLVSGYAMGVCTREILQAWGLPVERTTSVLGS